MKSNFIPSRYSGKKVGLEGRIISLSGATALLAVSPVYIAGGVVKKVANIFSAVRGGNNNMNYLNADGTSEYIEALKSCVYTVFSGRLPQAA